MSFHSEPMRWGTVVIWTLANAVSALLSTLFVQLVADADYSRFGSPGSRTYWVVTFAATFVCPALITAIAQWAVIRRLFDRARWWLLATTLGFLAGIAASYPVFAFSLGFPFGNEFYSTIVAGGIACGLVSGLAQWFVLQRWVCRSVWWILASAVGWTTAILFLFIVTWTLEEGLKLMLLASLAGGALYGSITGVTLAWLSRRAIVGRGFEVDFPFPQRKAEG